MHYPFKDGNGIPDKYVFLENKVLEILVNISTYLKAVECLLHCSQKPIFFPCPQLNK